MTIAHPSSLRRAIGVVRVSRVGNREGESFVSPAEQHERIEAACERDGLNLVNTLEEPNVSGGAPLARRPGLSRAVELVESGAVDVVIVAYFDRLVRSLAVQREVVQRVESAGGSILALDVGEVRADTAGRWLSSTMLGVVAEYHRLVIAERTAGAKHDGRATRDHRAVIDRVTVAPGRGRDRITVHPRGE
jgi:site-specific DNA recombinase